MSPRSFDSLLFIKAGPREAVWAVSVCARPLIRLHAAQTCAVLEVERFEDNRSADGDVRQSSGCRLCGIVNRIFEEQNWSHYTR